MDGDHLLESLKSSKPFTGKEAIKVPSHVCKKRRREVELGNKEGQCPLSTDWIFL